MKKLIIQLTLSVLAATDCATMVSDSHISLMVNFSDGSSGNCTSKNKRGVWESAIPSSDLLIRRSDDALQYDCKTQDGRGANGSIRCEVEGEKMIASVIF